MNRKYYVYIITFIIIVFIIYCFIFQYGNKKDQWIGEYNYYEDSEFIHEYYKIIIWEQNKLFFALIDYSSTQHHYNNKKKYDYTHTKLLAKVIGNNEIIDIVFLQTLPGDTNFGDDMFKKGERLIRLKQDEIEITTEWKALKFKGKSNIVGEYFKKEN